MLLLRVTKALEDQKIKYAIVGGFAVALHGAVRGTVDIDIVLKLSKPDFIAAEKTLCALGFEPRLPVKAEQIFDFREEYIRNKNLIAWSFYNPKRPSEVVDIIITHDLSKMKIKRFLFDGHTLCVLDLAGLIQMKKQSGRPQDLEDIKALEALKK